MSSYNKVSLAGLLIALGIIYGDIGTSPLYVLNAITSGKTISDDLVIGALSLIIWTLTLQTTIKYVILTLNADNRGEGGIFSLFALVRRRRKWLVVPAMIGGAALLADGMITPPISVTSAVEGLKTSAYLIYHHSERHYLYSHRHSKYPFFYTTVWNSFYRQVFWPCDDLLVYHAGSIGYDSFVR